MKESYIASQIDKEYQMKQKYDKEKKFRQNYCAYCKNKDSFLCKMTDTLYGEVKCVEFERKDMGGKK